MAKKVFDHGRNVLVAAQERLSFVFDHFEHVCISLSGGKDSTYQVIRCLEYNLKPLCVTASTDDLSPLGRENIENIKNLGVDYIEVTANPVVRKKINKFSLKTINNLVRKYSKFKVLNNKLFIQVPFIQVSFIPTNIHVSS